MWRETNLFGVYMPPLLVYAFTAFLLVLPLRALMFRARLFRWLGSPPLAQVTLYLLVLAGLVSWL